MPPSLTKIIDAFIRKIETIEHHAIENSELSRLSHKQIYYLDQIATLQNPTLSELATHLKLSKPSITAIAERFVREGYLVKVRSDADRRASHIHLTDKGKSISTLHNRIHSDIASALTSSLSSEESEQLVHLLSKALMNPEIKEPHEQ